MQGVVTDSRGAYVRAAIVRLLKAGDAEAGDVSVTYAETDEEGRFVIRDLDPNEKYIVEIDVKLPEQVLMNKEEAGTGKEEAVPKEEGTTLSAEDTVLPKEDVRKTDEIAYASASEGAEEDQAPANQGAADEEPEPAAAETKFESGDAVLVLSPEIVVSELPYDIDESDFDDEEELLAEGYIIPDQAFWNKKDQFTSIEYTVTENLSFSSLYNTPGFNLKDKPYLCKNNLW